ncbi:relA-associated inhibitor-like [Falco cherrug]|uniref:relA-associated inhibitor-like n=1 Tax=Falco cherrug TaxID=345164 RepID=UPI00247A4D49|nr:relA-associated inhibitor-like [Falco cherrug]XP_055565971.1 relA-associated inhibitor-like [Falco cherrug]XP_055565972.1 relA-associated inhibitor-like [Falco cherrug]XP_055565973.1 relA-associated inhibitor-like [Falco cherrug]
MPTGNGNISPLCLLLGEDAAKVYRDAWQAVGLEPLGHPAVPSKPGEDHQSKINRAYEPGSDDVTERTTELYNPPSPPAVSGPRDPGKLSTIGAVAAVVSLQVAIVLGCVLVWWRRKKKAPVAGASRLQHIKSCFYQCLSSQSRCPSTPEIWIPRQQTPLPPERPNYSPCSSPYPGTMTQRSQESIYEPQEPPQPQSPASLPSPPRTPTPKDFKPSEPPETPTHP